MFGIRRRESAELRQARTLASEHGISVEDAFALVLSGVADAPDTVRAIVWRMREIPGDMWDAINDVIHG